MNWIWLAALVVSLSAGSWIIWRRWIAPWQLIHELINDIKRARRPRTYLISGASEARRVGLALESVFERQQSLDRQLAERASGTETIMTAMQEGLLVVDTHHRIRLANRAFRELFGLPEKIPVVPLLEMIRNSDIDRLAGETLETGAPNRRELTIAAEDNGSNRFMELSAVPTRNEAGQVTGAAV